MSDEKKNEKTKIIFEEHILCPHCEKRLILKKTRLKLKEGVPAEYEEKTLIEKDTQQTLNNNT